MEDAELDFMVRAWLRYQTHRPADDEWALMALWGLIQNDFEQAWTAVGRLCEKAETPEQLCVIGSGPVEDLIRINGELSANHLEDLVNDHPQFIKMVACIWAWDSPVRVRIDRLLEKHEQQRL